MHRKNRVVVTGMGVLAPNGTGIDAFWKTLFAGESGIGPITLFDPDGLASRIAGEVKDFDPSDYIEPELKPRRMARHTQLAYAAAMMAFKDANIDLEEDELPSPTPVIVGVSTSALDVIQRVYTDSDERGFNGIAATSLSASAPQAAANVIADRIGTCASSSTVSSACPSGLDAVAIGTGMIRSGEAEIAIAGGTDAPLTAHSLASFIVSGLSSTRNSEPQKASRPFDLTRDSGVISEGACIFVLENLDRAQARGAPIHCEILGYGTQRDLAGDSPGSGLIESMQMALANAGVRTQDIDYICAYGPGHPVLDLAEVRAIKEVFGRRAYEVPVSSIKGVTGNPLAAGGPFQVAACGLMMRHGWITPTANYETPDPQCDLDFVPNRARKLKLTNALINVRGLGGSASSLVVSRFPDDV